MNARMFIRSIFLLFLITIISNRIDCFYYGDGDKALGLQASDLFKAKLDEKVGFNSGDLLRFGKRVCSLLTIGLSLSPLYLEHRPTEL